MSAQQIWGAERWLQSATEFHRNDGRKVVMPPPKDRIYHRVSVSLGGRDEVMMRWGDLGHGFVHVFDEKSLSSAFSELTTITDFVNYLLAVESLAVRVPKIIFSGGGVEELLAMYVRGGEGFGVISQDGKTPDMLIVDEGQWKALLDDPEYQERNRDLASSYLWDRMIDFYAQDLLTGGFFDMHSKKATTNELALMAMALQPRGFRAVLADSYAEFMSPDKKGVASRIAYGANETAFVFLAGSSEDREHRAKELMLRCLVVRANSKSFPTVVGIARDRPEEGKKGYSSDILYLHAPDCSAEDLEQADSIQRELGYFSGVKWPG